MHVISGAGPKRLDGMDHSAGGSTPAELHINCFVTQVEHSNE